MANEEPDKVINITLDGAGLPVPDQNPIQVKKDKQKIKWCAEFQFAIEIDGYNDVKYGTGSGSCAHTAKTGNFTGASGTRYKYAIKANNRTNDPDIQIVP